MSDAGSTLPTGSTQAVASRPPFAAGVIPSGRSSLWHFLEHQFSRYRTTWRPTIVSGLISPVLFLLTIGFGLGSQIDDTSTLGTDDYAAFVGPGVLAAVAMLQGGQLGLWPTLGALKWEGTYQAVLSTPLTATELATGHILWIGFRITVGSSLYVFVLALFGLVASPLAVLAPLVAGMVAMSFAAPVSAFSASRDSDEGFSLISRLIFTPLFLFSGAFFPVSQLPVVVSWISRVTPAWHGVEVCRHLINGELDPLNDLIHVVVILAWILTGWLVARRTFTNRLSA